MLCQRAKAEVVQACGHRASGFEKYIKPMLWRQGCLETSAGSPGARALLGQSRGPPQAALAQGPPQAAKGLPTGRYFETECLIRGDYSDEDSAKDFLYRGDAPTVSRRLLSGQGHVGRYVSVLVCGCAVVENMLDRDVLPACRPCLLTGARASLGLIMSSQGLAAVPC